MHNYKLSISYDGTCYGGWQVQPNARSIQGTLQEKGAQILQQPITLIGSGRTDAGVHAAGQIAHFKMDRELMPRDFLHSLNALLPADIRVMAMEEVPLHFHAQYSAVGKIYHYYLTLERFQSPFDRYYSLHVRHKIDLTKLEEASHHFLGTHDFSAFANEARSGSAASDPIRTLQRLTFEKTPAGLCLQFEGDGFLYKMVRNIVGTLLEVGAGKRNGDDIPAILASRDRRQAGKAAPPHGLFLWKVHYPLIAVSEG